MISDRIQDYPLDSSLLYHQMTISHMRFLPPTQILGEYSAGEVKIVHLRGICIRTSEHQLYFNNLLNLG